jgi:hypothetical protein
MKLKLFQDRVYREERLLVALGEGGLLVGGVEQRDRIAIGRAQQDCRVHFSLGAQMRVAVDGERLEAGQAFVEQVELEFPMLCPYVSLRR